MGYIEDIAAKDAARQSMEAAKKVEAAKILNQNGLAADAVAAQYKDAGYSMMDPEEYHALVNQQRVEQAATQNADRIAQAKYTKNAADRFNASKQYVDDSKFASTIPQLERYVPFGGDDLTDDTKRNDQELQAAYEAQARRDAYNKNVDPGLAAKWMADRNSFR